MPFILPTARRQPSGFVVSFLLHGGLAYVLVFSPITKAVHDRMAMARRYPILVLRPQDFLAARTTPARAAAVHAPGSNSEQTATRAGDTGINERHEVAQADSTPAEPAAAEPAP